MRYSDYGDNEDWLDKQLDMLLMADQKYIAGEITDEAFDITYEQVYDAIDAKMQPHVKGRRITCLSLAQAREIMEEIIGENDIHNKTLTDDWDEIRVIMRNNLREIQRTKLDKRFKELEGK